jgi:hypothetical protein
MLMKPGGAPRLGKRIAKIGRRLCGSGGRRTEGIGRIKSLPRAFIRVDPLTRIGIRVVTVIVIVGVGMRVLVILAPGGCGGYAGGGTGRFVGGFSGQSGLGHFFEFLDCESVR